MHKYIGKKVVVLAPKTSNRDIDEDLKYAIRKRILNVGQAYEVMMYTSVYRTSDGMIESFLVKISDNTSWWLPSEYAQLKEVKRNLPSWW